jgi:hypothetical protein
MASKKLEGTPEELLLEIRERFELWDERMVEFFGEISPDQVSTGRAASEQFLGMAKDLGNVPGSLQVLLGQVSGLPAAIAEQVAAQLREAAGELRGEFSRASDSLAARLEARIDLLGERIEHVGASIESQGERLEQSINAQGVNFEQLAAAQSRSFTDLTEQQSRSFATLLSEQTNANSHTRELFEAKIDYLATNLADISGSQRNWIRAMVLATFGIAAAAAWRLVTA